MSDQPQAEQAKTRKVAKQPPVRVEYRKDETDAWGDCAFAPEEGWSHAAIRSAVEEEVQAGRLEQGDYRIVREYRRFRVRTVSAVRAEDLA